MDYSWLLFFLLAAAIFTILKFTIAATCTSLLFDICLFFVSAFLSDTLVKLLVNTLPRRLLPGLQGKAVLVTGCDSGFGNLCARRLDSLGVTVFAGCLFPDGPGATELRAGASSNLHVVALDVTDDEQVSRAVQYIKQALLGNELWAVINNAGIALGGEIDWTPMELLQRTLDVNTLGVVRVTKAVLPMIKKSKGRIVCLSSLAGRFAFLGNVYYSMSKHAVVAFVDGLRREMRKWSVSVHGIEPNFYSTDITSAKSVFNMVNTAWESCPKETQAEYGRDYVISVEDSMNTVIKIFSSRRLHHVVDDMVDAAVGLTPKLRYVPGFLHQFLPRVLSLLPAEFLDRIQDIIVRIEKQPAALRRTNE